MGGVVSAALDSAMLACAKLTATTTTNNPRSQVSQRVCSSSCNGNVQLAATVGFTGRSRTLP